MLPLQGVLAGPVTHGGVRADVLAADGQVKQDRLGHHGQRHVDEGQTDAVLLHALLHTAGGIQSEQTAAGEHHGLAAVVAVHGLVDVQVPGTRCAAPDIRAGHQTVELVGHDDRAAGNGVRIRVMADAELLQIVYADDLEIVAAFYLFHT